MNKPSKSEAEIIITTIVYPGSTEYLVEFNDGQSRVSSTVKYYFNPVTQEESFQGDLLPIYLAIVGETPDDPSTLQEPDSILRILNSHGWTIVDDRIVEEPPNSAMTSEVRTIKIQLEN